MHPKDRLPPEEGIVHAPGALEEAPEAREVPVSREAHETVPERDAEDQVPKLPTDPPF